MHSNYELRSRPSGRVNPVRPPIVDMGAADSSPTFHGRRSPLSGPSTPAVPMRSPIHLGTAAGHVRRSPEAATPVSSFVSSVVPQPEIPRFSPAVTIVCDGSATSVRLLSSRLAMYEATRGWSALQSLDYVQQCLGEQVLSVLGDTVFACTSGTELVAAIKAAFCPAASRQAIVAFSRIYQQRLSFNDFLPVFTTAWSDYSSALGLDDSLRAPLLFDRLCRNLQQEILSLARHDPNWTPIDWCDLLSKARDAETTLKTTSISSSKPPTTIAPISRSGNSKIVCSHCKRNGHSEATCFKLHPELQTKHESTRPTSNCLSLSIPSTTSSSLPTSNIWISNVSSPLQVHATALLDTGSTTNFLRSDLADGFDRVKHVSNIRSIGGEVESHFGIVADIEVNQILYRDVGFVLVDNLPQEFDAILGNATLGSIGITLCDGSNSYNQSSESSEDEVEISCSSVSEHSMVSISKSLTSDQQVSVRQLLDEFSDCFGSTFTFDLNRTPPVQHRIELIDSSKQPPRARVRPLSPPKCSILKEQLDDLLSRGLVRPSKSPYASPVVLVQKPDGSTRFCVDYRQLNSNTKRDSYPLPRIQQLLEHLAGHTYYSAMDLLSGFWQVPMYPADIEKTAFVTPFGLFEFVVMPFGLMNATATFQRLTDAIFNECNVEPYVDDIVIAHSDFSEHLTQLRKIFEAMRKYSLKAKPSKCRFGESRMDCLGHEVSSDGIRPRGDSVEAVRKIPAPKNASELRSFLGLTGYYQKHIANYSRITWPLRQLLSKDAKFEWNASCEDAFNQLKNALSTRPIISPPNFEFPFVLTTDACGRGLGAVLHQEIDGRQRVIAYASQSLKPAEINYSTTEQEALAIVWAFDKFREYLDGVPFHLETDHRALQYIFDQKKPANSRIARWQAALQGQNYTIKHRSGDSIPQADALSRLTGTVATTDDADYTDDWMNEVQFCLVAIDDVKRAQQHDPDCMQLLADLELSGTSNFRQMDDGLLVRNEASGVRVVVPASLRHAILKQAHEESGYLELRSSYLLLGIHAIGLA